MKHEEFENLCKLESKYLAGLNFLKLMLNICHTMGYKMLVLSFIQIECDFLSFINIL